ncbi:toll-like receptor 13 [Salvelinus fontinalis]|uniref:toll-like receptor 13 n=1 Tax=Salvelinus fontinalis TaxID=8038 RepID=UPI002486AD1D|nr:toll-like receptor 13 [Salvelinus fontinalis]
MRAMFSHPAILFLWIQSASGWMHPKCQIYDSGEDLGHFFLWTCTYLPHHVEHYTAACEGVTAIEEDLLGLPPNINTLCISMKHGENRSMSLGFFSQFQDLEYLYIEGCLTQILPTGNSHLPNLQYLHLNRIGSGCCDCHIGPHTFRDLVKLSNLTIWGYSLSAMAPDVFHGMTQLQTLIIREPCVLDLSEVLCRIMNIKSLIELNIDAPKIQSLNQSNCFILNTNESVTPVFNNLALSDLSFGEITHIEEGALAWLQNLTRLTGAFSQEVLLHLPLSGIQQIQYFSYFGSNEIDIESICNLVFLLSIKKIYLYNVNTSSLSMSSVELCIGLEYMYLRGPGFFRSTPYLEWHFISSLKNLNQLKIDGLNDNRLDICSFQKQPITWLTKLTLELNNIHMLFAKQFSCLVNLQYLDLADNSISNIDDFAFLGLTNLESLDIGINNITQITTNTCFGLQLKKLTLRLNKLHMLFAKQFSCLVELQYLDLTQNLISNIEDFAFLGLTNLESLDITINKITQINANTFFGLHSLTSLDLRNNPLIHNIEAMSFTHLTSLRQVFLGQVKNPLTEPVIKLNLTLIFGGILSQLTHLYISSAMRPMQLTIGSNITSKQNLSLQLKGQTVSFEDCDRPFFQSVTHLHADAEEFLCGSEFMGKYFTSVETFDYRSKLTAKRVDLTSINQLIHLRRLTLRQVDLLTQRSADIIFHNLTKLEVLELDNCRIYSLEGSLTKDFKSLKRGYLHIENVYNVFYSFTEPLSSLKHLTFNNLQMFCSCDNAWLITWAKGCRQVDVIMLSPYAKTGMYALEDLICLSDNGLDTPNFVKYTEANCTTEVGFVLFAATGLGVLFFMLVVLVHNLAGPYLLPLYHITLGWLSEAMRSNTTGRYHYNAFVSYSGKDECWVVEELLPNLEQRGPPFLRLCLHSRDFQLGKDIVENITDSLYRSRHTLCLVSRHYLRSNWCSLEMKLATSRLQVEQRDILFLVFLEKIPPRRLSAHHRLARLVKTRTYLDWPQDPNQHQAFWDRLWAKLKPPTEA